MWAKKAQKGPGGHEGINVLIAGHLDALSSSVFETMSFIPVVNTVVNTGCRVRKSSRPKILKFSDVFLFGGKSE